MRFNIPTGFVFVLVLGMAIPVWSQDEADQYTTLKGQWAASHILIAHKRADRAKASVTRSKKEAQALANTLAQQLAENPHLFEQLASEKSDGPSSVKGGYLAGFSKGDMAGPFESAVKKLDVGAITPKPVKTQFGNHIIRREALKVKLCAANALVISFEGAALLASMKKRPEMDRDKAAAKALIESLREKATPENFQTLIEERGDYRTRKGFLGVFKKYDSRFYNQVHAAIHDLPFGGLSEIREMPFGFVVFQRVKVERRGGARILIAYAGAKGATNATRTKEAAASLAAEICSRLKNNPDQFAALAKEHSNGPFAVRGGVLVSWYKGIGDPQLEATFENLAVGQIASEPVETDKGYCVLMRLDP